MSTPKMPSAAPGGFSLPLVASLALNLFLGGMVIADVVKSAGAGTAVGPRRSLSAALPADDRSALRTELDAARDAYGVQRREIREAVDEVRSALRADPFDPEVLEAALERARDRGLSARALAHRALVAAAGRMSADGRATLAASPILEGRVAP